MNAIIREDDRWRKSIIFILIDHWKNDERGVKEISYDWWGMMEIMIDHDIRWSCNDDIHHNTLIVSDEWWREEMIERMMIENADDHDEWSMRDDREMKRGERRMMIIKDNKSFWSLIIFIIYDIT